MRCGTPNALIAKLVRRDVAAWSVARWPPAARCDALGRSACWTDAGIQPRWSLRWPPMSSIGHLTDDQPSSFTTCNKSLRSVTHREASRVYDILLISVRLEFNRGLLGNAC